MVFSTLISDNFLKIFKNYRVNKVTTKNNNLKPLLGNSKDQIEKGELSIF